MHTPHYMQMLSATIDTKSIIGKVVLLTAIGYTFC